MDTRTPEGRQCVAASWMGIGHLMGRDCIGIWGDEEESEPLEFLTGRNSTVEADTSRLYIAGLEAEQGEPDESEDGLKKSRFTLTKAGAECLCKCDNSVVIFVLT
ncbi:hypothetical protein EVAR_38405_1, partial [Eumeta japonica]